jgi:tellurium resistance protein TerZ
MRKDGVVNIPDSMKVFKVALGWDTELDIDCSLVCIDKWGNAIDTVYYGNLKSEDGAILHSGDNTTGKGKGDDETITISLDMVSKETVSIWPVITIFTSNRQFDDVKGAYCRIFEIQSKEEFCRFSLSKNIDNISNGNIMGNFSRTRSGGWFFKARGYYTRETKSTARIKRYITQIINNNLDGVKIGPDGEYKVLKKINT